MLVQIATHRIIDLSKTAYAIVYVTLITTFVGRVDFFSPVATHGHVY